MNPRSLHIEAMNLLSEAELALKIGDGNQYQSLCEKALEKEHQAAQYYIGSPELEPTRSVVLKSAASIAYRLGQYEIAERYLDLALAGNLPSAIKEEIMAMIGKIRKASYFADEELSTDVIFTNGYLDLLRSNAINFKIEPKERHKYAHAVVLDQIIDFLKNIQSAYQRYSDVLFSKNFSEILGDRLQTLATQFRKENKFLTVGLEWKSFGISVAVDNKIMHHRDFSGDYYYRFKDGLFKKFTQEIVYGDFNNNQYLAELSNTYTEEERLHIFSPLVESLKPTSQYTVSIVDSTFDNVIRQMPKLEKKALSVLKPRSNNTEILEPPIELIKRIQVATGSGKTLEEIQVEKLKYAEFDVPLSDFHKGNKVLYFKENYEVQIIWEDQSFKISDDFLGVYTSSKSFKECIELYKEKVYDDFVMLISLGDRSQFEDELLEKFKSVCTPAISS